jgi:hypothetical protein
MSAQRWNENDVLAAAGAPLHSLPKRMRGVSFTPIPHPQPGIRRGESAAQGGVAVAASSDAAGRTVLAPNGSRGGSHA